MDGAELSHVAVGWRLIRQLATQVPGAVIRQSDQLITFPTGGTMQVRSADDPQSLRGEGLDFLVMDECAFIQEAAWNEALRPALSDRLGKALFISTPKGRNWFHRAFLRGKDDADSEWASWQFPTSTNPHIAASEIEAARHSLPERVFAQEYLAQFIDDAGGVFRRVMDAATAIKQDAAQPKHEYCIGLDWAKNVDFTVITVIDITERSVVYIDRFNQIDYALQVGRLRGIVDRFKPAAIIAERNSIGEPLIEQLQREGMPVQPFTTTNSTKAAIIDGLALAFERGDIRIPNDQTLIAELQAFEMERLPSGMLRYAAPEGMHDDMVMSLALAWQSVVLQPQAGANPFF